MAKKYELERWTMGAIKQALSDKEYQGKKIVIPRFQRGQRWNENQETTFIDSLRKGYPVGTLMFYKTTIQKEDGKNQEVYTLVDGLQRGTAIYKYINNPMKYFQENEVPEEMLDDVFDSLGYQEGQKTVIYPRIRKMYCEFVKGLTSYDNVQTYKLAKSILNEFPIDKSDEHMDKLIDCLGKHFKTTIADYNEISSTEIPAIVYNGPEEDLPDIFTRINSKGTPLNQYEIFAASWPQSHTVKVRNSSIIEHILAKYDALNDSIYTVKDYDNERDNIRTKKTVTIFEYVFGLGKWLNKEFPLVSFEKNKKSDEITPIGFELLDACIRDSKGIGELYKDLAKYDVNKLETALVDAIKYVDIVLKPIISFKGNKRKENVTNLYAQNQIEAIIGFVFNEMFDNKSLEQKSDWNDKKNDIAKHIFNHFVFDILSSEWQEGSSKLHQAINSKRLLTDISPSAWESCLNTLLEDSLKAKEIDKVAPPSKKDIVFLNCIYLEKYTAMDQLSRDNFDIEHIGTKELMKKLINSTKSLIGLPISSIANLCYLPEHENRSKGENTFYSDEKYLSSVSLEEIEKKYSFTTRDDMEFLNETVYEDGDFETLKEWYIDFLKGRFEKQKDEFYKSMKIDSSKISADLVRQYELNAAKKQRVKKSDSDDGFDINNESTFVLKKTGPLAKILIAKLFADGKISNEEKDLLYTKDYAKRFKRVTYPVLAKSWDSNKVNSDQQRYYKEPIVVDNEEIFVTHEWFEESRKDLIDWFKEHYTNKK